MDYQLKIDTQFGLKVAFGVNPKFLSLPIVNLPEHTVKIIRRIRAHSAAHVFVKTEDGETSEWIAGPDGPNAMKLLWKVGANRRETICR